MKQKKHFEPCGHLGFGKFCHRCNEIKLGRLVQIDGKWNQIKNKEIILSTK